MGIIIRKKRDTRGSLEMAKRKKIPTNAEKIKNNTFPK
jgi:hypothetical protein